MKHSQTWNAPKNDKRSAAKTAVRRILASYPNSDEKASRDYVLLFVETLERYPLAVISRVADPQCGIAIRYSKFMPSLGEIVQVCNEIEDRLRKLQQPTAAERIAATPKEEPGPRLKTVDERKAFVKRELGYDPAVGKLHREAWCFKVPPPRVDISDFPQTKGGAAPP